MGSPYSLPITGCSLLESKVQRPRCSFLTWPCGPGRAPGWAEPPASPEPETNLKRPSPLPRSGTGKAPSPSGCAHPLTKLVLVLEPGCGTLKTDTTPSRGAHWCSRHLTCGGPRRRKGQA